MGGCEIRGQRLGARGSRIIKRASLKIAISDHPVRKSTNKEFG